MIGKPIHKMSDREYCDRLLVAISILDWDANETAPEEFAIVDIQAAADTVPEMRSPSSLERFVEELGAKGLIDRIHKKDGKLKAMITGYGREMAEHARTQWTISPFPTR